jgi:NIMA (never in mitosis gene a)-related kinase
LPKNLKYLKEKLPKSKYILDNKSFDEAQQVNSSFLPKISNPSVKPTISVPPVKSDRYQSLHEE